MSIPSAPYAPTQRPRPKPRMDESRISICNQGKYVARIRCGIRAVSRRTGAGDSARVQGARGCGIRILKSDRPGASFGGDRLRPFSPHPRHPPPLPLARLRAAHTYRPLDRRREAGRVPPFLLTFPCRAARGATKARRRARGRAARSGTAGGLRRARLDAARRPFRSVLRTEPGAWTRKRTSGPTRKATKPCPAPRLRRIPRQTPRRPAPQAAGHRWDSRAGVSWIFVCREAAFVSRTREGPQDGAARSAAGEGREADFGPAAGRAAPCGEAALPPSGLSCLRAERAWTNLEYPFLFNRNTSREFGRNSGRGQGGGP